MPPNCYSLFSWDKLSRFCQAVYDEKLIESESNTGDDFSHGDYFAFPWLLYDKIAKERCHCCICWSSQVIMSKAEGVVAWDMRASIEVCAVYLKSSLKSCMHSAFRLGCVCPSASAPYSPQYHRAHHALRFAILFQLMKVTHSSTRNSNSDLVNRALASGERRGKSQ